MFNLKFTSFKFNLMFELISFTFWLIKLLNLFVLIPMVEKKIIKPTKSTIAENVEVKIILRI